MAEHGPTATHYVRSSRTTSQSKRSFIVEIIMRNGGTIGACGINLTELKTLKDLSMRSTARVQLYVIIDGTSQLWDIDYIDYLQTLKHHSSRLELEMEEV